MFLWIPRQKKKAATLSALLPRNIFFGGGGGGGSVKNWLGPWECVAHVNAIRHVSCGKKHLGTADLHDE
jgi:hypothetical protein